MLPKLSRPVDVVAVKLPVRTRRLPGLVVISVAARGGGGGRLR